jgi:capsule polysaccharide export protein KpsC/LpsZ
MSNFFTDSWLISKPFCLECKFKKDTNNTVRFFNGKYFKYCKYCNKQTINIINPN